MSTAGFSPARLARMHQVLSGHIERGDLPGLVALVGRGDEVHVETLGRLAFTDPAPMRRDTIFRIASITKPIAAAAAMLLVDECRLRLEDPVERWLPELAKRRVLKSLRSDLDDTDPARRAITVRDVLTYRMGFGSVMAAPDTYPIQRLIREYRIGGDRPMLPSDFPATDEWLRRLGSLPWLAHPGERWLYHVSGDVLGILIARVSGQTLGAFLHERLFAPLGMKDTAFYLPQGHSARLPGCYHRNHQSGALELFDDPRRSAWRAPPAFESAAGGLLSTIDDYCAFSRMLLDRGRCGRAQLLSRAAVELMTADHLSAAERRGAEIFFGTHSSWGLGVAVDIRREEIYHSPGRFGWTGGFGTTAYVDPAEGMIGILFTQRMMDSPAPPALFSDFWTLAYAAMQ